LLNDPTKAALFGSSGLPTITLLDNGNTTTGDTVTGDGIYSTIFKNDQKEGHYQFKIAVRGTSAGQGDFQRTRTLTVFVRPKPAATNTEFKLLSLASQPDGSVVIRLSATPRDAFNNFIGPDYLGHMNISSSLGTVQRQLEDKLNGSYEISYHLPSAASNPKLSVDVMGTSIVTKSLSDLTGHPPFPFPKWLIWLLLLLLILILIWWVFFRKKGGTTP